MFTKSKNTAPTLRFDLRDEDPAYDRWASKIQEFKAIESRLDTEEGELLSRLAARPQKLSDTVNLAVSKLLNDDVDEADPAAIGLGKRLQEVQAQRRDVRAARAIAEQRQAAARHAASAKVCGRIAADYRSRVTALAKALIAAHTANAALYELTSALDLADVPWTGTLRPVPARFLGAANDRNNRVGAWLAEAVSYGLIDGKMIPTELAA